MARTNQGGSIVGFVIIGAVLVLGSAGLLYWVSHRDASPIKTPEVNVPAATEKDGDKNSDQTKPEPSTPDTTKEDTNNAPTGETQPTPGSTPTTDTAVEQIPQTGPADTLMQLLVVGLLAGTIAAFIRSRQRRFTL